MVNIIYIGLLFNYILKDYIIDWADDQIVNKGNNEDYIIELSFSSNKTEKEILAMLSNYITDDYNLTIEFYFSQFNMLIKKGYYNWERVEEEIVKFYKSNFITEDTEDLFYSRIIDDYYLRKDGFSGNMNMPKELLQFLSKYSLTDSIYEDLPFSW